MQSVSSSSSDSSDSDSSDSDDSSENENDSNYDSSSRQSGQVILDIPGEVRYMCIILLPDWFILQHYIAALDN